VTEGHSTIEANQEEQIVSFVREETDEAQAIEGPVLSAVEGESVGQEPVDELTALRQQLETAQAQADEYLDDLRRERAAFQNYKKRQENERAELRHIAQSGLLMQILPVLDDFARALEAVPADQAGQPWVEGIALIQRKLHTTLEAAGVDEIQVQAGQAFDPFIHEAVTYEEHDDHQEGEIVGVVQKGYKLGQRVLRPAMVRVAK
jgi:molecular chaperone GrpE